MWKHIYFIAIRPINSCMTAAKPSRDIAKEVTMPDSVKKECKDGTDPSKGQYSDHERQATARGKLRNTKPAGACW